MMLAAQLIADDTFRLFILVALVLFVAGTVMSIMERAWVTAFLCAGLVFMAAAWLAVS